MRIVRLPAGLRAVVPALAPTLLPLLVVSVVMLVLDGDLRDPRHAPLGVLSFEVCGLRGGDCGALLAHWSPRQGLIAAFGLGLDFLFIPLYVACLRAALGLGHPPLPAFWGTLPLVTGLCDGIENLALLLAPLLLLALARSFLACRQAAPGPSLR